MSYALINLECNSYKKIYTSQCLYVTYPAYINIIKYVKIEIVLMIYHFNENLLYFYITSTYLGFFYNCEITKFIVIHG